MPTTAALPRSVRPSDAWGKCASSSLMSCRPCYTDRRPPEAPSATWAEKCWRVPGGVHSGTDGTSLNIARAAFCGGTVTAGAAGKKPLFRGGMHLKPFRLSLVRTIHRAILRIQREIDRPDLLSLLGVMGACTD